jgi:hypothetical protein
MPDDHTMNDTQKTWSTGDQANRGHKTAMTFKFEMAEAMGIA